MANEYLVFCWNEMQRPFSLQSLFCKTFHLRFWLWFNFKCSAANIQRQYWTTMTRLFAYYFEEIEIDVHCSYGYHLFNLVIMTATIISQPKQRNQQNSCGIITIALVVFFLYLIAQQKCSTWGCGPIRSYQGIQWMWHMLKVYQLYGLDPWKITTNIPDFW